MEDGVLLLGDLARPTKKMKDESGVDENVGQ